MKTHLEDIRLSNNAGMSFPVCRTGEKLGLDLDATGYKTSGDYKAVDCKHCLKIGPKKYPWTSWGKQRAPKTETDSIQPNQE